MARLGQKPEEAAGVGVVTLAIRSPTVPYSIRRWVQDPPIGFGSGFGGSGLRVSGQHRCVES